MRRRRTTTSKENEVLQLYFDKLSEYPVLDRNTEEQLINTYYKTRDPKIAKRLINSNLRLVIKIAKEYNKLYNQNLADLIQEGNLGLVYALKKYKQTRGVKFSYYASFWIKAYILKYITSNWRIVKANTTAVQRKLFFKLEAERKHLESLGFKVTSTLLAKTLKVKEKDIHDMEGFLRAKDLSLDKEIDWDSLDSFKDLLRDPSPPPDDILAKKEMTEKLREAVEKFAKTLGQKQKLVFSERIYTDKPKTLRELGKKLNITPERVRQINNSLLKKLRIFLKKEIPDFNDYKFLIEI